MALDDQGSHKQGSEAEKTARESHCKYHVLLQGQAQARSRQLFGQNAFMNDQITVQHGKILLKNRNFVEIYQAKVLVFVVLL